MNLKINIQARLQRHARNATFFKKRKSLLSFFKKFKSISFIIVLILPIYPSFGAIGVDKEFVVGNYDESTILVSYEGDSSNNNTSIFSQDSGFVKPGVLTDTQRDMSGVKDFVYYEIQSGDSISSIASKFGVSANSILWSNNFEKNQVLKNGDTIRIPPVNGIVYTVESKDSLDSIAEKYKVDKLNILAQNQLDASDELKIGQLLILPGAKKPEPPKPVIIEKPVQKYLAKNTSSSKKTVTQKATLKSGYTVQYTGGGNRFAYGNCTYYVANHKNVTWRGNANQWLSNARAAGVPTGTQAVAGAIVSFRGSGYNPYYGHVGIVSEVTDDYIIVKDMNYRRFNEVTVRKVPINDSSIKGFIYAN